MNDLNKIDYENIDKLMDLINDLTDRLYKAEADITELKLHLKIPTMNNLSDK